MTRHWLSGAAALAALALAGAAQADSISFGDYFFPGDTLANGFSSYTDDNTPYVVSGPGTGFNIVLEGAGWSGEFVHDATLLFDDGAPGAVTISFQSPIASISGLAAQPSLYGAYTATLKAYDGATLLGSSSYDGFNALGPEDTISYFAFAAPEITSIVISTTNDAGGFAIGSDNAGIPEPATWGLLLGGSGMIGLALRRRRPLADATPAAV